MLRRHLDLASALLVKIAPQILTLTLTGRAAIDLTRTPDDICTANWAKARIIIIGLKRAEQRFNIHGSRLQQSTSWK